MTLHLAPLTPERFKWVDCPGNPRTLQRLANGLEAWVGGHAKNAKGWYDLYVNATLCIGLNNNQHGISLASLRDRLAGAMVHIRFLHPEVACSAVWEGPGPPWVRYTCPRNNSEALAWADELIGIRTSMHGGGLALRANLETSRRGAQEPARSVEIYLVADVQNESELLAPGTFVDMLLHFNHIFWDGISARMVLGDLLRRLEETWDRSGRPPEEYKWGDEIENLSPPVLDTLATDAYALDSELSQAGEEYARNLMRTRVRNLGTL